MKLKYRNTARLLFVVFFIGSSTFIHAQKIPKEALVLTKKKNGKTVFLKTNKKIKVWTATRKVKGRIQDIKNNDTLLIDNQLIAINEIERIRAESVGGKIFGGTLFSGGTLFTTAGVSALVKASSGTTSGCATGFAKAIGTVLVTGGVIIVSAGTAIFFIGKRYNCTKNWELSSALVSD